MKHEHFMELEILSKTERSEVSLVKNIKSKIKYIRKKTNEKEIMFLRKCRHQNIIIMLGKYSFNNDVYIILEYLSEGDLFNWCQDNTEPDEDEIIFIVCVFFYVYCIHTY